MSDRYGALYADNVSQLIDKLDTEDFSVAERRRLAIAIEDDGVELLFAAAFWVLFSFLLLWSKGIDVSFIYSVVGGNYLSALIALVALALLWAAPLAVALIVILGIADESFLDELQALSLAGLIGSILLVSSLYFLAANFFRVIHVATTGQSTSEAVMRVGLLVCLVSLSVYMLLFVTDSL